MPTEERERVTAQVLGSYLCAALATELVRGHGCGVATSWAEGVRVDGWHAAGGLGDLVQHAMSGPEGVAAVKAALRLEHQPSSSF